MRYEDITSGYIRTGEDYEDAIMLLCEEFPDHAQQNTRLDFYDYTIITKCAGKVTGLVTANKYLPHKVMICDIVIAPEHRGRAVGMKLLHTLTQKVKLDGYKYITGFTNKKNREALSLYKKLGGHQEEMIVTTADLDETMAIMEQKEMVLKARQKNNKRG